MERVGQVPIYPFLNSRMEGFNMGSVAYIENHWVRQLEANLKGLENSWKELEGNFNFVRENYDRLGISKEEQRALQEEFNQSKVQKREYKQEVYELITKIEDLNKERRT